MNTNACRLRAGGAFLRSIGRLLQGLLAALLVLCLLPLQALAQTATTTALTSNLNPAYINQSVTLTIAVSGSSPTGTVTIKDGGTTYTTVSLSSGAATVGWSSGTTGVHNLTATYNGNTGNAASTSAVLAQTVNPKNTTSVALSTSANPVLVGQSVTLSATVTGSSPTGTVTFKDGTNILSSASVSSGVANLGWTFSSAGSHSLTATYNGDTANATSTSAAVAETVDLVPTTTSLSCPASTTVMVTVNCTVTVATSAYTSALGGQSVKILEGSTVVGTGTLAYASAPSNFTSTIALPASAAPVNAVGAHSLQAQYAGNASTTASNSSVQAFTVNQRSSTTALTVSPTTAGAGQVVTLSASVTGTNPSGSIAFKDGSATLATVPLNAGQASLDTSFSSTGAHSLTASYSGDTNNTASTSAAVNETITATGPTSTLLGANPNPATAGQPTTLTAIVSGSSPSGTVVFYEGSATLGSAAVNAGQATLSTPFALAGNHNLSATYRGDTTNAASTSATLGLSVNKAPTTSSLSANPGTAYQGQLVALTVALSGAAPGGTVTFTEGATTLGTATVGAGSATLSPSFSSVGSHTVAASYPGDANNNPSNANPVSLQILVGPVPPSSPAPVANYEYDANGNPTKTIQAPGVSGFNFATSGAYDSLDRLKTLTDAKNGQTKFAYDGRDNLLSVTDPRNLLTQYPRNGLGDVDQLVSPDTGTALHTYDEAGNLKTRTDSRGVLATYTWDPLNRLSAVLYTQSGQPSQGFTWQYDLADVPYGKGRLGQANHPNGSLRYSYDAFGRVTSTTQTLNPATGGNSATLTHTVQYGYDGAGNVTAVTYPSGRKLTIGYTAGQATSVSLAKDPSSTPTPLITNIQWQPFGPVKSWQWQMATGPQTQERLYDTSGRLVRYTLGNVIRDLSYDAADRISSYKHYDNANGSAQSSLDQSFGYDELGRLTSITTATSSWTIGYDANGNRTGVTQNATTQTYTTPGTSNKLQSVSNPARSFGYDNAGNTTSDSTGYTATYDLSGRLATLTKGGVTTTYSYDNNGLRMRKVSTTGAGSTTVFAYDQGGHLLGEYDQAGNAIREYVWFGDTPIAVFMPDPANSANPPLVFYVHTDHLDTPRVIADRSNNVRWRWMAEPFGTSAPEDNPANLGAFAFNLRMPGQYADQESGLFYNWHRSFDPSIGRYVGSDPIGLVGGTNTYAYVLSQPTELVDPLGLYSTEGHNYFIDAYFAHLPDWARDLIKNGSEHADALPLFQDGSHSYMHAMSSAVLDRETARAKYCQYIREQMALYQRDIRRSRGARNAYYHLGMALHAVMDSTSPVHRGFQRWDSSQAKYHGPHDIWILHRPHTREDVDAAPHYRAETMNKMRDVMNGRLPEECGCQ